MMQPVGPQDDQPILRPDPDIIARPLHQLPGAPGDRGGIQGGVHQKRLTQAEWQAEWQAECTHAEWQAEWQASCTQAE